MREGNAFFSSINLCGQRLELRIVPAESGQQSDIIVNNGGRVIRSLASAPDSRFNAALDGPERVQGDRRVDFGQLVAEFHGLSQLPRRCHRQNFAGDSLKLLQQTDVFINDLNRTVQISVFVRIDDFVAKILPRRFESLEVLPPAAPPGRHEASAYRTTEMPGRCRSGSVAVPRGFRQSG